ncbi:MAG: UMP kinase [Pseudomonadota bacterium]
MTDQNSKRYVLKLSGEALAGSQGVGHDAAVMSRIASEIASLSRTGFDLIIVVGGGNVIRGAHVAAKGGDHVAGDHMGMLGTLINGIALREAIRAAGEPCTLLCAFDAPLFCAPFSQRAALEALERGDVLIVSGGIGNPFVTTDTGAAMRAAELGAAAILKATQVDGVYSADPKQDATASRYERLTLTQALSKDLKIMDTAALALAQDHAIPICVFSIHQAGALAGAATKDGTGTWITP